MRIVEGLQEIEKKGNRPTFPRMTVGGLQACGASLAGTASGICSPLSSHLVSPAPGSQAKQVRAELVPGQEESGTHLSATLKGHPKLSLFIQINKTLM